MHIPALTRRTQILLDEDRFERLRARADERGTSIATLIREAIDRTFPAVPADRAQAARDLLAAEPMQVEDWPEMKRDLIEEMWDEGIASKRRD